MAITNDQVKEFLLAEGMNVEDPASCNRTYNKMLDFTKKAKEKDAEFGKFARGMFASSTTPSSNGKKLFHTYFPKYKTWVELLDAYEASIKK
jgi:hypothetical protein